MATARNIPTGGAPTGASEPKLPSEPLLFSVGYDLRPLRPEKFIWSFALHLVGVAALVAVTQYVVTHRHEIRAQISGMVTDISPYILSPSKTQAGGGGGGGDRDKLAASKGALPKLAREQITPPTVIVRNENPRLAVPPSVVVPPEIRLPQIGQLGDPLSTVLGPASNGTGSGGGIGSGSGGGVGSGRGPGVGPGSGGGIGGGVYRVGGGVSAPRAIYSPEPEFSEEARKAKYQGVTVLWVVVGTDGRVRNVQIQRSLGMGLDEKAIAAVREWKFEPARKDGVAVAVQVAIEVSFRLY